MIALAEQKKLAQLSYATHYVITGAVNCHHKKYIH